MDLILNREKLIPNYKNIIHINKLQDHKLNFYYLMKGKF